MSKYKNDQNNSEDFLDLNQNCLFLIFLYINMVTSIIRVSIITLQVFTGDQVCWKYIRLELVTGVLRANNVELLRALWLKRCFNRNVYSFSGSWPVWLFSVARLWWNYFKGDGKGGEGNNNNKYVIIIDRERHRRRRGLTTGVETKTSDRLKCL